MSYAAPAGSSGLRNDGLKQRLRGRSIDYAAEDAQAQRELDQLFALADSGGSAPPPRAAAAKVAVPVTYLEATKGGSAMKAIPVLQLDPRVLEHLDQSGVPAERGGPAEAVLAAHCRLRSTRAAASAARGDDARAASPGGEENDDWDAVIDDAPAEEPLSPLDGAAPFPPSPLNAPVFDCGHGCGPTVDGSPPWRGPGADPAAGGAPDGSLASLFAMFTCGALGLGLAVPQCGGDGDASADGGDARGDESPNADFKLKPKPRR